MSPRRRPLLPRLAAILVVAPLLACGDDGTSPHRRVDLEDDWSGDLTAQLGGPDSSFEARIRLRITSASGGRLDGTGRVNGEPFQLSGSYRPPVLFIQLDAPEWSTFRFVGETSGFNVLDGTLTADGTVPLVASLLLFRR